MRRAKVTTLALLQNRAATLTLSDTSRLLMHPFLLMTLPRPGKKLRILPPKPLKPEDLLARALSRNGKIIPSLPWATYLLTVAFLAEMFLNRQELLIGSLRVDRLHTLTMTGTSLNFLARCKWATTAPVQVPVRLLSPLWETVRLTGILPIPQQLIEPTVNLTVTLVNLKLPLPRTTQLRLKTRLRQTGLSAVVLASLPLAGPKLLGPELSQCFNYNSAALQLTIRFLRKKHRLAGKIPPVILNRLVLKLPTPVAEPSERSML